MDLNVAGKAAVVTGASKGIGLAVARALAAEGARVTAGARHFDTPVEGVRTVRADLGTADGPPALIADAVEAYGGLNLLVNNVGATRPRTGGFLSITDEDWVATLSINLLSAVRATRAALPHLLASRGTIVTVASVNATLPDPLVMDYSAAKAALASFCKSLSKEVGPRGMAASDRIGNVTGADFVIDGGLVSTL